VVGGEQRWRTVGMVRVGRVLKDFGVPRLSVASVKDGKVLLGKGLWGTQVRRPDSGGCGLALWHWIQHQSIYDRCACDLVDAGKLSWDDPVYQRLPGFQMYDPYVSHEMTIGDLLAHRSGMGLGEGDLLLFGVFS